MSIFNDIRKNSTGQQVLRNVEALGLPADTRALHILWMYPDVLNVFGSRGDLMALFRISCEMKMPVEMRRLNTLEEEIPLDWADLIYYASGDLTCMEDLLKVQRARLEDFRAYADSEKMIVAVSSSGVILAEEFRRLDGTTVPGLGLLKMTMTERETVHGDDLWIRTSAGLEVIGNQIQLTDVTLGEGQKAFGKVIYGRGNDGTGQEGAETGNILYTGCVGPALVRNPWLAAHLLERAAMAVGVASAEGSFELPEEAIEQELLSAKEAREFINEKKK
ncbi:MAG: hypothetical protein IJH75_04355 [Mogibacterium sp.]|nr:hypothetical protein [Mogibacterium sp.]